MKHPSTPRAILTAVLLMPCGGALPPACAADASQSPAWQWAGWGGGSFFWGCLFNPTNPQVLYLGGDVSGLCKSDAHTVLRTTNGGADRQEITGDLPSHKTLVLRYYDRTKELWAGHVGIYRLPQL